MKNTLFILICLLLAGSCNPITTPITTAPAVIIGLHDKSTKRQTWLERAEQGDVYSMYELAESYCCSGSEGDTDNIQAIRWYCRAAKTGFAKAQTELGKIYEGRRTLEGINIKPDYAKALMWYSVAAKRGTSEASDLREELKKTASAQDIKRARMHLRNYKAVTCGASY